MALVVFSFPLRLWKKTKQILHPTEEEDDEEDVVRPDSFFESELNSFDFFAFFLGR